jgi:peptidoglycan/xylan/chitin deacetylase (PgdA/CDA1 family)
MWLCLAGALSGTIGTMTPGVLLAQSHSTDAASKEATPQKSAENALTRLAKGDYANAAQQTIRALRATPGDPDLHILAGVLLLHTGNGREARTAFQNALSCDPEDPLARYGLGLAQLAGGDRTGALDSFARAERGAGDKTYTLLARRYTQWLDGAQVSLADAGFSDQFAPAQYALAGLNSLRGGNAPRAAAELQQAQESLPGDAIVQPGGVLMTFDPSRPLSAGASGLPREVVVNGLAAPLPAQRGLSGAVQITPEDLTPSVAYVGYELDGKSQGIVNVHPYALTLDTRQVTNGWHTLTIITYDNQATEMNRVTRRVRTFNRIVYAQSGTGALSDSVTRLRASLWDALTLRPDRFACTYALGVAQQKAGDIPGARHWFARACAVHPDSPDARRAWTACGGAGTGGEAMWGGLPDEKVVALTFDDGPKPGLTEPLLDLLTAQGVPATFFVIGRHVMEYPDLTRKIDAAGMEIANHSYTHPNLTKISAEDVAREMMQTQAAVQVVTGKTPRYMRPPGGNWNPAVASIVRQWGLTPCMWTVDVYGSEVIGAQQVADAVLAQVRPGSVVLMHNGKLSTLQALPTIIKELRTRGYAFATVDALARRLAASQEAARQAAAVYSRTRRAE